METPVCDLVLLSWNHLEETRPCLETLFAFTGVPCRLLIVDNASEPPVREFLAGVTPRGALTEVRLLQNETNEGFPLGMNRGIRASSAPYVCVLNNDLRFTSGWLEEMIRVAQADPTIGVVNPTSNTFGNRPPRGMPLEAYARHLRSLQGRWTEVGMCTGFCMLITREVVDRVGALSEEVDRAFFEDEDYSMRAQQAGYRCVVAESAYVFHTEHRSVRTVPEREALFARNQRWCHTRWGRWVRIVWPRFEPVVPGSDELRQWLERLVSWARRRTLVYVFAPTPPGTTQDTLFRSVGLIPHADIHWQSVPERLAPLAVMGHVVKRRKKPFDLIVAPNDRWAQWMNRLQWLHRAEVVHQDDQAGLMALWRRKARPSPT